MTVALAGPVRSLDPALVRTREGLRAAWLVYTPPLTYRRAGGRDGLKPVPGVAASQPGVSDDELTWNLQLRRGLRYSDGRRLRAADVERGIARSLRLDPGRALPRFGAIRGARAFAREGSRGFDIAGITTDEATGEVQFELDEPDADLRYALASLQAAPVPAGTRFDARRAPPGIGPFSVRRAGPRSFTLTRVDGFDLDGVPSANVDSVSGRTIAGSGPRMRRVLAGRADATEGEAPLALLPSLRSEYGTRYEETPSLRVLHVRLDDRRRPFSDADARKAVSYALDVRALGRIWAGLLDPACNLMPPQLNEYRRTDECPFGRREGDSELIKARNLIERSPARNARVFVWGGGGPRGRRLARYLADQLTAIGMRARVARTHGPAAAGAGGLRLARRRGRPGSGGLRRPAAEYERRGRGLGRRRQGGGRRRRGRAVRRRDRRRAPLQAPRLGELPPGPPALRARLLQPLPALSAAGGRPAAIGEWSKTLTNGIGRPRSRVWTLDTSRRDVNEDHGEGARRPDGGSGCNRRHGRVRERFR